MHSHPTSPQPLGAARALERHPLVRRPAVFRLQVGATDLFLSPSVLSRHDYWQLNEHRRRCEELGAPRAVRLARLIRAKLLGAWVTETADLPPDVVAGTSRATFVLDHKRPETRQLYHWDYPGDQKSPLPVRSFLGIALIGMTVGQCQRFPAGNHEPSRLHLLGVLHEGTHSGNPFD